MPSLFWCRSCGDDIAAAPVVRRHPKKCARCKKGLGPRRPKEFRGTRGDPRAAVQARWASASPIQVQCLTCDALISSMNGGRSYCPTCKPIARHRTKMCAIDFAGCDRCGGEFVKRRHNQRFCPACLRRKRQSIPRKVRLMVLERDGYVCHICQTLTDRNAQTFTPMAPTIDHVVPVSKGGTNNEANLRCAHFSCNLRKSDRDLAEVCA